ncbi:MAG TPA: cadherin-like domain-containing protein [Candidatus Methylomirabilis sp.]|nr:cadherin-like domain-containing protein [Candidatus Methylomirabilis sp.]
METIGQYVSGGLRGRAARRWLGLAVLLLSLVSLLLPGSAHAVLQRMGPINNGPTVGGFPSWFQDTTGLAMEFCDPLNQAELNGGWCTLIPPAPPTAPESFPNNFFIEHFYWDATNVTTVGATKVRFTMAMEASFTNGAVVVPGQQMTFGRIRIFMTNLPFSGTYTVYHPYGKWVFDNQVAGDRLFFTDDVGLGCPGTFTCTLETSIGPFLLPSATSGGPEVPPIPDLLPGQDPFYDAIVAVGGASVYPGTGKKYIADPKRIGPVTGSPLPPFVGNDGLTHDHNTLRIEGPNGFVIDAPNNFTLTGRLVAGAIPGATTVDRASYAANASGTKLDVFATANESTATRLPAQPAPPTVKPLLSFYETACAGALTIDPVTGVVTVNPPPYTAPATPKLQMTAQGSDVWGQSTTYVLPPAGQRYVCVEDDTARDALGNVVPAFYLKNVTDDIFITLAGGQPAAFYDGPNGGTLTVTATSSDITTLNPVTLTLQGYGVGGTGLPLVFAAPPSTVASASVTGLLAPPAKVQVVSSSGDVAELKVTTAVGGAVIGGVATAVNDTVTMFEDCSATPAASCATPQVLAPLANDTLNGGPIPAGAVVAITQAPRLGTAVVNLDGTISYTPNANANGSDSIAYTVTVGGQVSNTALISITITPVADPPTAIGDTTGALRGVLNKVSVFANDVDPDGAANLNAGSAVIVTGNAALGIVAGTSFPGGVVSFTPPATTPAGPQTFTYNAVDADGLVSATPATVTVNVSTAEAILVAKDIYTQSKGRWTVSGTDSPAAGQTLTITYDITTPPTFKVNGVCTAMTAATNPVIGTATVDALGNWLYDQILANNSGVLNPSNTLGNSTGFWCSPPKNVRITSSLTGASVTSPISLK